MTPAAASHFWMMTMAFQIGFLISERYGICLLVTFSAWFHYFWVNICSGLSFSIVLGAAEEATAVFGEAAAICIQKQYVSQGSSSQSLHMSNEDRSLVSLRNFGPVLDDASPRQLKHLQGNNQRDIPGNYHGAAVLGGAASQPSNGGSSNLSFYNTPSPMASQVEWSKLPQSVIVMWGFCFLL